MVTVTHGFPNVAQLAIFEHQLSNLGWWVKVRYPWKTGWRLCRWLLRSSFLRQLLRHLAWILEILQPFRCLVTWPLAAGCHVTNLYLLSLDHFPCRWYWVTSSYFSWAVINATEVASLSPTGCTSPRVFELSRWSGNFRWHGMTICTEVHWWAEVILHHCLVANLLTGNRYSRQLWAIKGSDNRDGGHHNLGLS